MPETNTGSEALWLATSRWLEATLGLHFTPSLWPDLQRGLHAAAVRLDLPTAAACAERAVAGRLAAAERQVLTECLTIGETYFFRDLEWFAQVAQRVLAPLISERSGGTRHLRLWSAGCSSGEEPYSLAMLVASLLPQWREWNISILATDINDSALRKARAGVYGRWSVRGALPPAARQYLQQDQEGRYHVDAELRRLVRFAPLNLAGEDYPAAATLTTAMDLVVCRNVLIYFEAERGRAVLERLGRALAPDGWLLTGSVETLRSAPAGLVAVGRGGFAALRRNGVPATGAVGAGPLLKTALHHGSPLRAADPASPPAAIAVRTPYPGACGTSRDAVAVGAQARQCADAGDLRAAEDLCRQAIAHERLNAEWTYLLASILLERGQLAEAAAALQRTLYLAPGHLLARFSLGTLALRRGHPQAGRRHFSHALARLAGCRSEDVVQGGGGLTVREFEGIIRRAEAATL